MEFVVTLQRRQRLCEKEITLNGNPATISGWKNDFANITSLSTGERYEWSWETVDRIVTMRGGRFES